jgi:hypothetical protein
MSNYYHGNLGRSTSDESDSDDEHHPVPGDQWLQRPPGNTRTIRRNKSVRYKRQEQDYDAENHEQDFDLRPTLQRQASYNSKRGSHPRHMSSSMVRYVEQNERHTIRSPNRSWSHQQQAPQRRLSKRSEFRGFDGNPYGNSTHSAPKRSGSTYRTINQAGQILQGESIPNGQLRRKKSSVSYRAQPQRASSLPMTSVRKNIHSSSSQDAAFQKQTKHSVHRTKSLHPGQPNLKRQNSTFTPKRSKSIHRAFQNHTIDSEGVHDVWVQRVVMGGPNEKTHTYFKALYSGKCRAEPPTGATAIVYLDDIVEHRGQSSETPKPSKPTRRAPDNATKHPTPKTAANEKPKKRSSIFSMFLKTGKEKK